MDELMLDTPDPDTTCSVCYAEFLDPEDLSVHINQVHSTEIEASLLKCHFCDRSCADLESYAVHIRSVHLCDLRCCKYCNRVFNDINEFRRHDKKHHRHLVKSKYYCSNCNKVFTTISELEIHEFESHRYSGDGIFLNEVFPILSSLLNIKVTRFLQCLCEHNVLYVCVNCEHTTPNVSDYIEHLTKMNCRSLACDICWSVYKHRKGLRGHYTAHPECFHNVMVTKQCTECCKDIDVRTLKEHSKICKAIKCKRCEIVFETMNDLTKHQSELHPAVVHLQVCKYCNKDFAGNAALEKHIQRSHESHFHLYKYKCIYCDVIFKHPKKLFGHFFSTHKDLEPYTCKICDKKFRIRKNFTLHIKLDHKSIGFVEFDEQYHVFFRAQKSENPFNPSAFYSKENVKEMEDHTLESHTEVEQNDENDSALEKQVDKPKNKVQFNVADKDVKTNIKLVNVNSDFMSATETEGNQTEGEIEKTQDLKRKITSRMNRRNRKRIETIDEIVLSDSSDEDEPLLQVKKRAKKLHQSRLASASRTRNMKRFTVRKGGKNRFVCNICNKQCFTYQNYNNHIALHKNNISAKCVKCQKVCKSKKALTDHYAKEHSSSKLTETLKNLLEKRKNLNKSGSKVEISNNEKFKLTIKKVSLLKSGDVATVTPVGDKPLSVQKFIESFTPETEGPNKEINIQTDVIIKQVSGQPKKTVIQMTKCNLDNTKLFNGTKLALPVQFTQTDEQHKVTVKVVTPVAQMPVEKDNDYNLETFDHQDTYPEKDSEQDPEQDNEQIPEVAQEVMLEGSEEPPPKTIYIPHKVVIPKLATQCKKIHIAHLQPEAPYYKIVKVEEALNFNKKTDVKPKRDIKLPDGTTLVSVNPLAHLLGDTPVEKILEGRQNKNYKPKAKDFETAVAKAMLKLKNNVEPTPKRKKKNKDEKKL